MRDGAATSLVLRPTGSGAITGSVTCDRTLPRRLHVGVTPRDHAPSGEDAVVAGRGAFIVDGRFRVEGLAAGRYRVEVVTTVDSEPWVGTVDVDLDDGAVADVTVPLAPERE